MEIIENSRSLEREAKLPVADLTPLRTALQTLGATHQGKDFERNWVYDLPDDSLRHQGKLLRIRQTDGLGGLLTVKGPVEAGHFKTREEVETVVDSIANLIRALELLGYRKKWLYEKRRDTWHYRDCEVLLDECPEIGSFIEIEGTDADIAAALADLGLDPSRHVQDSYLDLWRKHLAELGEEERDMVFS